MGEVVFSIPTFGTTWMAKVGKYALLGTFNAGLYIIDITEPSAPVLTGHIDNVPAFDIKVWDHFAYTVTGGSSTEGAIIDLEDPSAPQMVNTLPGAHNLFVDEKGYLYLACPGVRIYDLNTDPQSPDFLWTDQESNCHDVAVVGDRLYDFHGQGGSIIYDVTDRSNPLPLGFITDPQIAYSHSGWISPDGLYLYNTDEGSTGANADITVWDISNVGNPQS